MDLFVVNRHKGDEEEEQPQEEQERQEKQKLDKLLKKIERNKKIRNKRKEKEARSKLGKQRTIESREIKRKLKASIIRVPENKIEDFLDQNDLQSSFTEKERSNKKTKIDPQSLEGFTVLGTERFASKPKVKRILPTWLANPTVISVNLQDLNAKVSEMKQLDKGIRKLLKSHGIEHFFPVQAEVIPWLLRADQHSDVFFPRDICVSAPTGSGKTLAFVLPVIQSLKRHCVKRIRALVILPTKDLAVQVFRAFRQYSQGTKLDVCLVNGDNSFAIEQSQLVQENKAFGVISKADILVCTAGRLVDHLKLTVGFDLQNLEFLIIDEADRVLENVQNDWLYHLGKHLGRDGPQSLESGKILNLHALRKRRHPQKLLFSATLSQDPEKLQKLSLFQPKLFTSVGEKAEVSNGETFVGKFATPKELKEKYVVTSAELKPLCLYKFVKVQKLTKTIVFTHSAESTHRLAVLLRSLFNKELTVEEVSSQLQGKSRSQLITKFSRGEIDLLICTDALARGIDLPCVQCVISYSVPKFLKTYIHRAGRTARAGEDGLSVTLLDRSQVSKFKNMRGEAEQADVQEFVISEEDLEPLGEQYKQALQELRIIVDKEEKIDLQRTMSAKGARHLKRKRKDSLLSNTST